MGKGSILAFPSLLSFLYVDPVQYSTRCIRCEDIMTKVEAIVRPSRFDQIKEALSELGIQGMTVGEVRGHGRQKGHSETYRGREYEVSLIPKLRIEIVVADNRVEEIVEAIITNAATGEIGDGKIFLYKAEDAIRIRNRQRGEVAL
jgi:nitrogen regulatory protein P-II 1